MLQVQSSRRPFTNNAGGATFQTGATVNESDWPSTYETVNDYMTELNGNFVGYGWARANTVVNAQTEAKVSILKQGKGDLDDAFVSGATNVKASMEGGSVRYRLTVKNDTDNITVKDFRIIDVLPAPGDTEFAILRLAERADGR